MTRPHHASIAVLTLIAEQGPAVTDEQLADLMQSTTAAVSNRIWWLTGRGFIDKVGKGPARRMTVTDAGRAFLANPTRTVSKPKPKDYGPAKRRRCLMCQSKFTSAWEGHRICGSCRETEQWKSGYEPECFTAFGGR